MLKIGLTKGQFCNRCVSLKSCIINPSVRSKQPNPRKSRGGRVPVWSNKPKVARKTAPSTTSVKIYTSDASDDEETDKDVGSGAEDYGVKQEQSGKEEKSQEVHH